MTTTYEFSLFAEGVDLSAASTVERLEHAGYTHPAAAAHSGVQALVFARRAERLPDAVAAATAEAECIPGVCIAREARSGAIAVFDARSLKFIAAHDIAVLADPGDAPPMRTSREASRSRAAWALGLSL